MTGRGKRARSAVLIVARSSRAMVLGHLAESAAKAAVKSGYSKMRRETCHPTPEMT